MPTGTVGSPQASTQGKPGDSQDWREPRGHQYHHQSPSAHGQGTMLNTTSSGAAPSPTEAGGESHHPPPLPHLSPGASPGGFYYPAADNGHLTNHITPPWLRQSAGSRAASATALPEGGWAGARCHPDHHLPIPIITSPSPSSSPHPHHHLGCAGTTGTFLHLIPLGESPRALTSQFRASQGCPVPWHCPSCPRNWAKVPHPSIQAPSKQAPSKLT